MATRTPVLNTKEDWCLGIVLVWTFAGLSLLAARIAITVAGVLS